MNDEILIAELKRKSEGQNGGKKEEQIPLTMRLLKTSEVWKEQMRAGST